MNKLLISHRGNLRGPNPDYENNPEHIVKNVLPNFDCEVDLRFDSHNNTFYLGHDFNQYEIDFSWLDNFSKKLWIHCKDFDSLDYLCRSSSELNYFWHENDSFTITSKGYIWTYPNSNFYGSKSINVDLNKEVQKQDCYGICSDYVESLIISDT